MKNDAYLVTNLELARDWLRQQGGKSFRDCAQSCQDAVAYVKNIELALEKARELAATYRGMYESQKQYSNNVLENYCKLESENKALRERVRKWEEFTREWAEDANPAHPTRA